MTPQGDYPTVITNGDPVLIVQAWEWGKVFGRLDVNFDENGRIVSYNSSPVLLLSDKFSRDSKTSPDYTENEIIKLKDSISRNNKLRIVDEDKEALEILKPYKKKVDELKKVNIGKAEVNLYHVRVPGETDTASGKILYNGSFIAPIVADSMLWKAKKIGQDASIAIVNAGGVRTDIPEGDINIAKVYELLPFENTLFIVRLSGAEVKEALESGIERAMKSSGSFPYVAGIKYNAVKSNPAGKRVTDIVLLNSDGSTIPLSMEERYKIVVASYIAGGGDGYQVIKNASEYRIDSGFIDTEVFMEYVKEKGTLKDIETNRISFIQ